ncbi:ras GEF [Wolfiporia cocos MD-104 SS10]|uniref:Ras GEF n=1 Tax=Wolfiporia cocos (strain MD-104) TaxID=742152 RepID=A0A2H3JLJ1_WOLCO|nr:ras GEF [Wolfiporia cocos MD-104 SS10]
MSPQSAISGDMFPEVPPDVLSVVETRAMTSPGLHLHFSPDASPSQSIPPLPSSSRSQVTMPFLDAHGNGDSSGFSVDLPPEIASADISIAPDLTFVETSSGAAARELKRRYDQYWGVGKDVRSPYAITAFTNQHGKQMFRVGLRDLAAPAASAEEAEHRASSHYPSQTSRQSYAHPPPRQRIRMSVHSFLPVSVFKNGSSSAAHHAPVPDGARSPPIRKLRKTRSIPNLVGVDTSGHTNSQSSSMRRPHAHSVSSADSFRASLQIASEMADGAHRDVFADVMGWSSAPLSPASQSMGSLHPADDLSAQDEQPKLNELEIIVHPFGTGVSFDSPSWWPSAARSTAPALRPVQSFESGLTARADDKAGSDTQSIMHAEENETPSESYPPPLPLPSSAIQTGAIPSDETMMHSRYSTGVFDVLQTSRGLPALDRITSASQETTIRLSLKADDSAAPRDDPRFVIWGEVEPEETEEVTLSSATDLSSAQSGLTRRRSTKNKSASSSLERSSTPASPAETPVKMLLAATIERWIAQLTSELNYDELLAFFLTYRTYVSALDLGHLLICRFHWALGEPTSSRDRDVMVRRIVRVRTFTAIRYWVVTFFDADFVPNRELRQLFANWINSLRRDPILQRPDLKDAVKIVRSLRKVLLECKDGHLRRVMKQTAQKSERVEPQPPVLGNMPSGHSSDLPRRMSENASDEPDIDLDFDTGMPIGENTLGMSTPSSTRDPSGPLDLATLRQPLHLAFLQYGKKSPASPLSGSVLLPVPHNTISRVLVNTIGRLGRWKRVLNSRAPGRAPLNALDVSAFNVEANETGDLLLVRGGVEQYLKMVENQMSQAALSEQRSSTEQYSFSALGYRDEEMPAIEPSTQALEDGERAASKENESEAYHSESVAVDGLASRPLSSAPSYSSSMDSPSTPVSTNATSLPPPPQELDVISIDDLDLSDLSSDEHMELPAPPGLKKLPRRLPNRRDFEFVRHSMSTVSSMGVRTHASVMSTGSNSSNGPELGGPVLQQWQVNALVDSLSEEDEAGDVEAALRRLEGQINEEKQRAKQSKVDRWVRSMRERQKGSRLDNDDERYERSSDEEDYGDYVSRKETYETQIDLDSMPAMTMSCSSRRSSVNSVQLASPAAATHDQVGSGGAGTKAEEATADSKPAIEDVVPLEILQSRVESNASNSVQSPSIATGPLPVGSPRNMVQFANMKRHHSFVLHCRAETLMQHFSMIDRELFLSIRFEELVSPQHMGTAQETNILDWAHFLRERARMRAEGRVGQHTNSLTLVRARFNLISNFVISEIVLTHPSDRMRLVSKFIRLAWKAYELKNFNTLVAIVAGLLSHWVKKAMQQCPERLRLHDRRILDDLTSWTSKRGHFMYIRHTVEALTEAKPIEVNPQDVSTAGADAQPARSRATSECKPPSAPACVPFFGVYVSQLQKYTNLPDLIDPTAPHEPVGIDPATNTFEAPAHPEVFSTLNPLPPSLQLEPLINVHKQRLVAGVVKSFVAAQHLASRVQFPLDKKLFQRCLKLRGLDTDTLERALTLYADAK